MYNITLLKAKKSLTLNWESILTNKKKHNQISHLFYEYDHQFLEKYCNSYVTINLFSNEFNNVQQNIKIYIHILNNKRRKKEKAYS